MSQENVEIVRAAIEAYKRGDPDAALKDFGPSFEWDNSRSISDQRGIYTIDQVRDFWAEFDALWESIRLEIDEFIDAGDQVVTPFTNQLRGRGGIELEGRGAWVWTIRDAFIVRVCLYQERREALEAAGLAE